jgi:hypothetical protein
MKGLWVDTHTYQKECHKNLTSSCANLTEDRIRQWFTEVEGYLRNTNNFEITSGASRVFNCDETAFLLALKGIKVWDKEVTKQLLVYYK